MIINRIVDDYPVAHLDYSAANLPEVTQRPARYGHPGMERAWTFCKKVREEHPDSRADGRLALDHDEPAQTNSISLY